MHRAVGADGQDALGQALVGHARIGARHGGDGHGGDGHGGDGQDERQDARDDDRTAHPAHRSTGMSRKVGHEPICTSMVFTFSGGAAKVK